MPKIIKDGVLYNTAPSTASGLPYNNSTSGLVSSNVQGAIDELAQGGGGGSGGHTIVDGDGTSLTQRTNLQFNGAYLEDNSTDNTTEVSVVRSMTKAEFDLLSADEKQGIIEITDEAGGYYHEYSTNEHIIGTWVDGSTLYEKTIAVTQGSSATSYPVASDIDVIFFVPDGSFMRNSSNNVAALGYFVSASDRFQAYYDGQNHTINIPASWSGTGFITYRYTKSS